MFLLLLLLICRIASHLISKSICSVGLPMWYEIVWLILCLLVSHWNLMNSMSNLECILWFAHVNLEPDEEVFPVINLVNRSHKFIASSGRCFMLRNGYAFLRCIHHVRCVVDSFQRIKIQAESGLILSLAILLMWWSLSDCYSKKHVNVRFWIYFSPFF